MWINLNYFLQKNKECFGIDSREDPGWGNFFKNISKVMVAMEILQDAKK